MISEPGFWGLPTSTIDWCEQNYVWTSYVAELFNSASSLAIVGVGLVGYLFHRKVLEARFKLAFALVTLVGIGSVAFHATLRFELQLLDELPMLYCVLVMVYILMEDRAERRFGPWFPWLLVGHGLLVTLLTALSRGDFQFYLFHLSFGSLEVFSLVRVALIFRRRRQLSVARKLFALGMSSYALGIGLWFIDLHYCQHLDVALPALGLFNPQLHAFWHVLVSIGLYLMVILMAHDRALTWGRNPRVSSRLGLVRLELS